MFNLWMRIKDAKKYTMIDDGLFTEALCLTVGLKVSLLEDSTFHLEPLPASLLFVNNMV